MQDFTSLVGISTPGTNVVLTWTLAHLSAVNAKTIVSVAVQRSDYESTNWVTLATSLGADFAGSTYTDVPGAAGDYSYRLEVIVGIAPHTTTLHSNNVSASMVTAVTLTGSANGRVVSLSWTAPASGEYVATNIDRSADGGITWFPAKRIDGHVATDYAETLANPGTYAYRVRVEVEAPEPEPGTAIGTDREIVSNTVSLTLV
jgi:hypothetical protein